MLTRGSGLLLTETPLLLALLGGVWRAKATAEESMASTVSRLGGLRSVKIGEAVRWDSSKDDSAAPHVTIAFGLPFGSTQEM